MNDHIICCDKVDHPCVTYSRFVYVKQHFLSEVKRAMPLLHVFLGKPINLGGEKLVSIVFAFYWNLKVFKYLGCHLRTERIWKRLAHTMQYCRSSFDLFLVQFVNLSQINHASDDEFTSLDCNLCAVDLIRYVILSIYIPTYHAISLAL